VTGPEAIARRIALLESRVFPDVMIWGPDTSASGKWEALGDGWSIEERNALVFCRRLEARLTARISAEEPPFPADQHPYRVVADRLAERIRRGEFADTGQIPSEARLCEHYGLGVGAVRHARKELVQRGLVYVRHGHGTFVT
jgi:GntR family transcriptional regulator